MERACLARPKARSTAERRSDRLGLTHDESPREHVRRKPAFARVAHDTDFGSGAETESRNGLQALRGSHFAGYSQPHSRLMMPVHVSSRLAHSGSRTHPPLGRLRAVPYMHTITKVYAHEGLCTCTQRSMPHKGLVTRRAHKSQLPTWLTHTIRPANARADEHTPKT